MTLPVLDIPKSMGGSDSVTVKKMNDKHVIVKLKCQKCPCDFFTRGGYNNHLFMDHKIQNFRLHPPAAVTNEDTSVTTSERSGVSGGITPDEDINKSTPKMLDESKSDRSLPDIPAPIKPVRVTGAVPEEDRDLEKFYCDYCKDYFFTRDGVRQHMDNVHFRHLDLLFEHDPVYVDQRKKCPKPPEDNSRDRKKQRQETSVQERNDSVGRRKRVRISTEHKPSDISSDVINTRQTRSKSILILQDTKLREEEMKNVKERDTSLEMSKEEYVKSYHLRRKDDIVKMRQKKESDESKRKPNTDDMKGAKDGKSENTVTTKKGSKDMEPKVNSGNIPAESGSIKGDESADDREKAAQDNLNDDSHAAEGQSQDIDTQQDSAYRS